MSRAPVAPCPFCSRHVRLSEAACPFCSAALPDAFRMQRTPDSPAARLHRAALHALRVGAVSMTAAACGGSVTNNAGNGDVPDAAAVDDASGTASSSGGSSGSASSSGGGSSSSSGGSADDASFVTAAYGGFIEVDASTGRDAGSGDGASDATPDHVFIAPPYGLPPPRQ